MSGLQANEDALAKLCRAAQLSEDQRTRLVWALKASEVEAELRKQNQGQRSKGCGKRVSTMSRDVLDKVEAAVEPYLDVARDNDRKLPGARSNLASSQAILVQRIAEEAIQVTWPRRSLEPVASLNLRPLAAVSWTPHGGGCRLPQALPRDHHVDVGASKSTSQTQSRFRDQSFRRGMSKRLHRNSVS